MFQPGSGILCHCFTFISAKQYAYRRVIAFVHHFIPIVIQVCIYLPGVAMFELFYFQINQYMAFQDTVIKYQVDEIVFPINQYSFLSGLEAETIPQLQQELLKMIK